MLTTGVAPPPRSSTPRPAPPVQRAPTPPRSSRSRSYLPYERILRWSLLASLALHGVALLVSPAFLRVGPPPGDLSAPDRTEAAEPVIRLLNPVIAADLPEAAPEPGAARAPQASPSGSPAIVPVPGPVEEPAVPAAARAGAEEARSARDALRPGYRDSRLWVNPRELRVEEQQSNHERYMEHLQARVDALNDSLNLANRGPDTDWTFRDKDGRRWGLSEDGLHLGGLTVPRALLPLPGPTGDNQTLEAEREKQRQREEIIRQEEERARKRTEAERARAIRERRERERRSGGGG